MIKHIQNSMVCLALITMVVTTSGCIPLLVGAAAGAGGVAYVRGNLEKNFEEPVDDVHKATLAALKNMDIFVTQDELNRHDAVIKGEYSDGEAVDIKINALTEKTSKVKVRIGVFGDELKSQSIMNAISSKL